MICLSEGIITRPRMQFSPALALDSHSERSAPSIENQK